MGANLPFLIFGIFVLVAILAFVYSQYLEKKRTDNLSKLAEEMGLSYFPQGNGDLQSRMSPFELFNQGRSRLIKNLITGETDEVRISIFDYRFTTGSGKNQSTQKHTVAALESNKLNVPQFSLRPENFFDKVGSLLGFKDINFDDHPVFSGMFVLKGPNQEAIKSFFDHSLLDFFAQRPTILVEGNSRRLIYYRPGIRKPEEIQNLLSEAYQVFGAIVDRNPTK
jgi:hypothetical protein